MTYIYKVSRTELARNTRQVLTNVQRGRLAVIESHGQPEAALLDITDYHLLRAVLRYYIEHPSIEKEGLSTATVVKVENIEERYNLVLAHYLAKSISLGRMSELLEIPLLELRNRCLQLGIPLRNAPTDIEEAQAEIRQAEKW